MKQYKRPTKTKEDFIIYKKVVDNNGNKYLLEMFVPKGSWMYSPDIFNIYHRSYRKIRVSQVVPLKAWEIKQEWCMYIGDCYDLIDTDIKKFYPYHDKYKTLTYELGKLTLPDKFDMSNKDCSNGIHGFFHHEDAIRYN